LLNFKKIHFMPSNLLSNCKLTSLPFIYVLFMQITGTSTATQWLWEKTNPSMMEHPYGQLWGDMQFMFPFSYTNNMWISCEGPPFTFSLCLMWEVFACVVCFGSWLLIGFRK
jgi:hypothetical protein